MSTVTSPNHRPVVEVEDLYVEFEVGFPVLEGFSLEVPRGSICGLLGRNGCGKSTLLGCLLGQVEPERGSCRVLGMDSLADTLGVRYRVGFVPQEPQFEKERSGEQQLDFIRALYGGLWNPSLEEELLDDFGLTLELHKPVGQLSMGQQRQLSLVVALAIEPELLLLDEPTVSLDVVIRRRFTERVVEFMSAPGRTVILASHQINEVERLVDHVVVIDRHRPLVAESLESLKGSLVCLTARFPGRPPVLKDVPGLLMQAPRGNSLDLAHRQRGESLASLIERLEGLGATSIDEIEPSLEEIFVHLVEGRA